MLSILSWLPRQRIDEAHHFSYHKPATAPTSIPTLSLPTRIPEFILRNPEDLNILDSTTVSFDCCSINLPNLINTQLYTHQNGQWGTAQQ
jgi:hypothetical protein